MEHDETGCQAPLEGPILCISNCGFFGSVATMNMCSKCYKDTMLKQDQAKLAASSIGNIVNGKESAVQIAPLKMKFTSTQDPCVLSGSGESSECETEVKVGPTRCVSCKKRVGLTGFSCRCGNLFCATHRYSDKHDCPFDYHNAARDAIAKSNPIVKAEKLDKI